MFHEGDNENHLGSHQTNKLLEAEFKKIPSLLASYKCESQFYHLLWEMTGLKYAPSKQQICV